MPRGAGALALVALLLAEPTLARADEPPAPPAPTARAVEAAPPAAAAPACADGWVERVYQSARGSVVRVLRPDGSLGTGFAYFSARHVATAFHVVDLGRTLVVELPNGDKVDAVVVATDTDNDLAILELDKPIPDAKPFSLRHEVAVGMPVMALGHPYGDYGRHSLKGLLNYSVSRGIVSAVNETLIQTDTPLSPGNSGGPIFACDGSVVGIADLLLDNKIGFAVRAILLQQLAARIDANRPYRGQWDVKDATLGLLLHSDVDDWAGAYFGASVVGYDRIALTARLGALTALPRDESEPVVRRSRYRGSAELTLGYRLLVLPYTLPTYATLSLGAAGALDRGSETRLAIEYDAPGCPGAATCAPKLASRTDALRGGGVMPMASLEVKFLSLEIGYAFHLDVHHPKLSTQRAVLGIVF
jgi:S1-C subfamily serine protease